MSLQTITEINLDINQPGIAVVHAKQYDTVRKVKANLFYNGVKWHAPSSNYVAVVGFKKADRIGGFYDTTETGETAVTVETSDRSVIYIILDRNVVTTEGNVNTEITFYDTITLGRLSTFSFIVQVDPATVQELDLASNPYFNVLAEDIKEVLEAKNDITGLTASASSLPAGSSPTVTVTGGHDSIPYKLAFGIPKGDAGPAGSTASPSSTSYAYAVSDSGTTVPTSGWTSSASSAKGKYLWSRAITTWSNDSETTVYSVAYNGNDGTGAAGSIVPYMDSGNGSVGSANAYAREDHVHPTDTSRASAADMQTVKSAVNNIVLYFSEISVSARTGTIARYTNNAITPNHILVSCVFANSNGINSSLSWATGNGVLTLTGTCTEATTASVVLIKYSD